MSIEDTLERIEHSNNLRRQKPEIVETAEEVLENGYFSSMGTAVEYANAYENSFDEVDGALEYLEQYSSSLGTTTGIIDSLR